MQSIFTTRNYKMLSAAVLMGLMGGFGAVSDVWAEDVTGKPITFDYTADSKNYQDYLYSNDEPDNTDLVYDFTGKNLNITSDEMGGVIGQAGGKTVEIDADKITLNNTSEGTGAYGIYLNDKDNVNIYTEKGVDINVTGGAWMVDGIFMGNDGLGVAKQANLYIKGNVTMRGTGTDASQSDYWGIKGTDGKGNLETDGGFTKEGYIGSRWAPEGIYLGKQDDSSIYIDGLVDMTVYGNGVVTDAYYKIDGKDSLDNVITIKGGNIETPRTQDAGYFALAAFGGTINMNMQGDESKPNEDNLTIPDSNKVTMIGNIYAIGDDDQGADNPYYFTKGKINLALTTPDSSWEGIVSNTGKTPTTNFGSSGTSVKDASKQIGEVNLWLSNGASWLHDSPSLADGVNQETMPSPSQDHYGVFDGISHVTKLTGDDTGRKIGNLFQKSEYPIEIKNYSGYLNVYYDHSTKNPSKFSDYGDITIVSASKIGKGQGLRNSEINLITSSSGIRFTGSNPTYVKVLSSLAQKLYYTNYASEGNLDANVKIADGLTSSSAVLKSASVVFTGSDGQGSLADLKNITGELASNSGYKTNGILKLDSDGTYKYTFSEDTAISETNKNIDIVHPDHVVNIDAGSHTLTLTSALEDAKTEIHGVEATSVSGVNITAGKLVIDASNSKQRVEGIRVGDLNGTGSEAIENDADHPYQFTVKGDTDIHVLGGNGYALGVYTDGNAEVTFNGNVTMKGKGGDDKWGVRLSDPTSSFSYYGVSGIYAGSNYKLQMGPKVYINGDVDLAVQGNGLMANGGHSFLYAKGGSIEVDSDNTKGFSAIDAECGTVNMNVNSHFEDKGLKDQYNHTVLSNVVDGAGSEKVTIKGNLTASAGAINENEPETYTRINLGLTTADSTWTGVANNSFGTEGVKSGSKTFYGEINLWLQNGAQWTNELYGPAITPAYGNEFTESHLANLYGGTDGKSSGVIFQKDKDLLIDNYSGNTKVFYEHTLDDNTTRDNASLYDNKEVNVSGGKLTITKAAANSGITLITDNKGLTDYNEKTYQYKNLVNDALNKLANKLYYSGYADALSNLNAKVEIAEGLTASSQSLAVGDVLFSTDSTGTKTAGQGYYDYTVTDKSDFSDNEFTDTITGDSATNQNYVNAGILADAGENYNFTKSSTVTAVPGVDVGDVDHEVHINAKGQTLTITSKKDESATVDGIKANSLKGVTINADKLVIDARNTVGRVEGISVGGQGGSNKDDPYKLTINGDTDMKVRGKGYALGLYAAGNSEVTFNGNVTALGDDTSEWGLTSTNGAYGYYGVSLIYSGSNYALQMGPKVTINGDVNAKIDGNALFANGGHAKLTINGGGNIEINKDNKHTYYAMMAESGTTSMNVNLDDNYNATSARTNDLVLKGNIGASTGALNANEPELYTTVNLGLATSKSEWTGVAHNGFNDDGNTAYGSDKKFYGAINVWLQNGATWNNEKWGATSTPWGGSGFSESHLAKLVGGDSEANAGIINQNDSNPIRVDNYSGSTTVIYKHEIKDDTARDNAALYGNKAASIIGGDFKITNAAEGSTITLLTDSTGVDTASTDYKDQNLVYDLMDKLAGKLYYSSYADGHLKGIVKIAEGLTASSAMLKMGDISFYTDTDEGKTAGEGYYKYDVVYPSEQVENPIDKVIDGSEDSRNTYRNDGVYHDSTGSYDFTKNPAEVTASDHDDGVIHAGDHDVKVTTKDWLHVTAKDGGIGMAAENGKTAATEGNTRIAAKDGIGVKADKGTVSLKGHTIIGAGTGMEAVNGGSITADGTTDITAEGEKNALHADGDGSIISLKDGTISGGVLAENKGRISTAGAVLNGAVTASKEGTISLDGGSAGAVTADGGSASTDGTSVDGILSAKNGGSITMTNGSAKGLSIDKDSAITAKLDQSDASIQGDIANEGTASLTLSNGASWTGDSTGSGKTDASIGEGSTWTGRSTNQNTNVELAGTWKQTGDSTIASLTGKGGTLDKTSETSGTTAISHASGTLNLLYSHSETDPTTFYGGDTTINTADTGTTVNMITDSKGLTLSGTKAKWANYRNQASETLNQMAHKLHYTANDGNIKGTLKIAEGLTSSSASLRAEDITFDETGTGSFKYDPVKDDLTIEYGSEETQMMKGTKSALLGAAMMWRSNNNDLQRRMGDVRLGQEESGVWARYVGGKNKFDKQNTYMNQSYDIAQVGYDRKAGDWLVGAALDYGKGDVNYTGGKGKEHMATLALYGTRVSDDGKYFDIIFKTGRLKDEFHVSNEIGNRLNADYHTWGNSLSAEYGKRFVRDDGFYLDPSVELTVGRLNSKDFNGHSDLGDLSVKQHAFDSAIGRIGLGIGRQTERSNAFVKLALAHEFGGSFRTDYYAEDGGLKSTKIDLQDTWLDMEIGGSLSIGRNTYLYGTYTHNFGADMETKWRADVGVRYTF